MISVILPARDESDRLMATIRSVAATRSTNCDLEIVIVDDASTDGCCSNLVYEAPRLTIKVLRSAKRIGVPHARNLGVQNATGEILFITDAHVRFCRDWDRHVLENIKQDRVIAATIVDPTSSFKGFGCRLVVPFMGTRWNRHLEKGITPIQIASCAGTVLKRKLFEKIGGYDSGMILYGAAEPEFGVRCWLSGAEIVSVPQLEIQHRFKPKAETTQFLEGLRPFMIHNSLRFGLLYLSDLASLQMIRYFAMTHPDQVQEALRLIKTSDVWQRKEFLKSRLQRNFDWFIDRFNLKDQVGQNILLDQLA